MGNSVSTIEWRLSSRSWNYAQRGLRGTISKRAIDPQSVNAILKQRAELAGLNAGEFSAHGLRSGYLTETANRGSHLPEAMEQSRHRSVQQASSYYTDATRQNGRAARLL